MGSFTYLFDGLLEQSVSKENNGSLLLSLQHLNIFNRVMIRSFLLYQARRELTRTAFYSRIGSVVHSGGSLTFFQKGVRNDCSPNELGLSSCLCSRPIYSTYP